MNIYTHICSNGHDDNSHTHIESTCRTLPVRRPAAQRRYSCSPSPPSPLPGAPAAREWVGVHKDTGVYKKNAVGAPPTHTHTHTHALLPTCLASSRFSCSARAQCCPPEAEGCVCLVKEATTACSECMALSTFLRVAVCSACETQVNTHSYTHTHTHSHTHMCIPTQHRVHVR
jgi:hypothetical protein